VPRDVPVTQQHRVIADVSHYALGQILVQREA
jgi:hypothetical protein